MEDFVVACHHFQKNCNYNLEVTAFDICDQYIVIGTKYGSLYFWDTNFYAKTHQISTGNLYDACTVYTISYHVYPLNHHFFQMHFLTLPNGNLSVQNDVITEISVSPDNGYLAYASSSGRVNIIKVSHIESAVKLYPNSSNEHLGSMVTQIAWSHDGRIVYIGDDCGTVSSLHVTSNLAASLLLNVSLRLLSLQTKIIQLDICGYILIVSTTKHSYICHTKDETFSTIGVKPRKGEFGCCFFYPNMSRSEMLNKPIQNSVFEIHSERILQKIFRRNNIDHLTSPKDGWNLDDVRIFCSRPRSRLWECNLQGEVLTTFNFSNSKPKSECFMTSFIDDQNPKQRWTHMKSNGNTSFLSFKLLFKLNSSYLLAICLTGFCVIDVANVCIKSYESIGQQILKAKLCRNILILQTKDGSVLKYELIQTGNQSLEHSACHDLKILSLNVNVTANVNEILYDEEDTIILNDDEKDTMILNDNENESNIKNCTAICNDSNITKTYSKMNLSSPFVNGVSKESDTSLSKHTTIFKEFMHSTRKLNDKAMEKVVSDEALEEWLTDYYQLFSDNNLKVTNNPYLSPLEVSQIIKICMRRNIIVYTENINFENFLSTNKYTPVDKQKIDYFYSCLIADDYGLLDYNYLMNNLSTVGIHLYPRIWIALLRKIDVKSSCFQNSEIIKENRQDLTRSDIVICLNHFFHVNQLDTFVQVAASLSNEHVIFDVLYILLTNNFDAKSRHRILYQFLAAAENSVEYYAKEWSICLELQYEIINCILNANAHTCICNVSCIEPPNICDLMDALINLQSEYRSVMDTLHFFISKHYVKGMFKLTLKFSPNSIWLLFPFILQFGNESDILETVKHVPCEMYEYILKFIATSKCILRRCLLCETVNGDLVEKNYIFQSNQGLMGSILNVMLVKLGPKQTLDLLRTLDYIQLDKRFYQKCIKLQLDLLQSTESFAKNPSIGHSSCFVLTAIDTQNEVNKLLLSYIDDFNSGLTSVVPSNNMKEMLLHYFSCFPELLATQLRMNSFTKGLVKLPHHWGIETNINYICRLCSLDLTTDAMLQAGGLHIFQCGCAFHEVCVLSKRCPICRTSPL